MLLLTQYKLNRSCCFTCNSHLMISTQIRIYTIYNTLCDSNVVVHRFIRKALHPLTGARVISTFSVRIETAAIVFKWIYLLYIINTFLRCRMRMWTNWIPPSHSFRLHLYYRTEYLFCLSICSLSQLQSYKNAWIIKYTYTV